MFLKSSKIHFCTKSCFICTQTIAARQIKRYRISVGCIAKGFSLFYPAYKVRVNVFDTQDSLSPWPLTPREPTPAGWEDYDMFINQTKVFTYAHTDFSHRCLKHTMFPKLPALLPAKVCIVCGTIAHVTVDKSTPCIETTEGPCYLVQGTYHLLQIGSPAKKTLIQLTHQLDLPMVVWIDKGNGAFAEADRSTLEYVCAICHRKEEHARICQSAADHVQVQNQLDQDYTLTEFENIDDVIVCWSCNIVTIEPNWSVVPASRHIAAIDVGRMVPLCGDCATICGECNSSIIPKIAKSTCFMCSPMMPADTVTTHQMRGPVYMGAAV